MYSTFPAISGDGDRDDDRDEDLLIVKEKCYPLEYITRWTVLIFWAVSAWKCCHTDVLKFQ